MKVKVVLPFLKENESDFKVHCGRGSTDTFLPLRLFLQDQSKFKIEYSCAMKSHFRKIGNQMSGSGNHLCEFTCVMFYLDRIPLASICHVQHQCL